MATLDQINRTVTCEVLPDFRKRVTRRYDIVDGQATMKDDTKFDANVRLPWGTEDDEYSGCRLVKQDVTGQTGNPNITPNNPPAFLIRVFEEIPANDRVMVGDPAVSYNQYGFLEVVIEYIQFSDGTTPYTDTVGSSTAPSPYSTAILKTVEGANDGTLRSYKLTYTTGGTMDDTERLLFGGKVLIREISSLITPPATPSGYTLTTESTYFVGGLQAFKYGFAKANGGGGSGTGGVISTGFTNSQGGNIAFDPANPDGATGEVVCTIRYVSQPSITTNPITQPTGFVLFALDVTDDTGYRLWESKSGFGGGNSISVDVNAQPDGALIYTVDQNDDDGTTVPAYPGSGTAYNVKTTHTRDNGFWRNRTIWHKPPATVTYSETMGFEEPGIAEFVGSPPQFVLRPPKQRTLLVDVAVSFATTQDTTAPFDIEAYGSFYETYTPTDTGVAVQTQRGLGGYLAQASGISGTNSNYNGVLCDSWEATLLSSIPSTFPTGTVRIKTQNDPYLTDINGVQVFRRTAVSYSF